MTRLSLVALFGIVLGAAPLAAQQPSPATPDYYAGEGVSGVPLAENCPAGNCPDGYAAHGHGLHGFGKHGKHAADGVPPHWGLAYASGYPNGIRNHGVATSSRDWKGPGHGCRTCSNGECQYRFYGQPDLFYNYYAWPSCTGLGAELYISPRPVPPHVGWTYITYQPLMPHEFLYSHHRTYHRYYNGGQGLNRTHVSYHHSWLPWK
jgi:hypothetical protein